MAARLDVPRRDQRAHHRRLVQPTRWTKRARPSKTGKLAKLTVEGDPFQLLYPAPGE